MNHAKERLLKFGCLCRAPVTRLAGSMLDLVFPRNCAICHKPPDDGYLYLCGNCRARLPLITYPLCEICGQPADMPDNPNSGGFICSHCRTTPPWFDHARSIARYTGIMRRLILDFKYHNALWLRRDLQIMIRAGFYAHYNSQAFDAVTFVPLHAWRERHRTFNQARVLCGSAIRAKTLPVIAALRRTQNTETQTHLTASRRNANVEGVFKISRGISVDGLRLLLIDDVMTTGATVNECARILKHAGAVRVCVLTLARG